MGYASRATIETLRSERAETEMEKQMKTETERVGDDNECVSSSSEALISAVSR